MNTVHELLTENGLSTALAEDADIPVISGKAQAQGDLIVCPMRPGKSDRPSKPIPTEGIELLRGNGGHVHLLIGEGTWTPDTTRSADLGVLTVGDGETAFLIHEEHGGNAIGEGCYRLGQQEEMWDQVRRVAD